jgi:hypothetical protein
MKKLTPTMAEALCAISRRSTHSTIGYETASAYADGVRITHQTLTALQRRGLIKGTKVGSVKRSVRSPRGRRVVESTDIRWDLTKKGKRVACKRHD